MKLNNRAMYIGIILGFVPFGVFSMPLILVFPNLPLGYPFIFSSIGWIIIYYLSNRYHILEEEKNE